MSPGELEAKGLIPFGPADTPSGEISDAQATIAGYYYTIISRE